MPAAEPVRLFMAADRMVFRHVPAVLNSALAVTSRPIELGLVTSGVSQRHRARLARKFPTLSITFHDFTEEGMVSRLPRRFHLSPMAYARLLMPSLVDWDRYVYLDVDTLVLRDLAQLYDTPLEGRPAAAVYESNHAGFNSGVLLVDAQAWRARELGPKMLAHAQALTRASNPLKLADQACLNAVLGPEILPIDGSWNRLVDPIWTPPIADPERFLADTGIVHFITGFKPWNIGRFLLPAPIIAAYRAHADTAGLPVRPVREAIKLAWLLRFLWLTRKTRAKTRRLSASGRC